MRAIASAGVSPQPYARIGGMLYLLIIAAGLFAEFVRERFVAPGNAAATASSITYLTLSTAQLLSPPLASVLFPSSSCAGIDR